MKQEELLTKIVDGNIGLIKTHISMYDRYNSSCHVLVTPQQVKKVLIDYIHKKINSNELQIWADFLCFNDALSEPNHENEDYYESMWHVLQKISTPLIDGEINNDRIFDYISELEKKYK